ncbi:unnamed protein product, partial [Iphiclides podalirius]
MASDQSETSGGSRVRQFGLYRSIDARTEEFLRLSRKRQMRQGCACAAISTAITVTIIVSILLVFEFNVIPNAELKSMQYLKSLLNDTAEVMTLNKENLNIDKATLKMLPMLMKALKKNNILHNTIEDTTKHSVQEGWHTTTEFTYKKNVFSDRNNWIRFPTSKAYAIEYKTSPVVYFKTPKNDYFTKIRKIRDYERIINYMDKMISDRVSFGSTQPMQTVEDYAAEEIQTERTFTMSAKRSSQVAYYPYESPMPKTIITTTRRPNVKIEVTTQSQIVPQVATMIPFFEPTVPLPDPTWPTNSPDIIRFSREDAKIPAQYLTTEPFEDPTTATTEMTTLIPNKNIEYDEDSGDVEARTLIIKLVNNFQPTTPSNAEKTSNGTNPDDMIKANTYVPQTNNGHYRNVERARKILIDLLKENSEKYRKNRLKTLATVSAPTYVPMYVEIKRNHTKQQSKNYE